MTVPLNKIPADQFEKLSMLTSMAEFMRGMWHIIEPGRTLIWNWHLDAICEELHRIDEGKTQELVVCMPPGFCKSVIFAVFWPAWRMLRKPSDSTLYLSHDQDLALRDSRRTREIVRSDEYQELIKLSHHVLGTPLWEISKDQDEKHLFANTAHGFRQAGTLGGRISGKRANGQVIDDPYDADEAASGSIEQKRLKMQDKITQYDDRLSSRLNDRRKGFGYRIVVMQRLHRMDLAGVLIERGVRALILPMEFDPERPDIHPLDPRTKKGELLFPEFFTQQMVDHEKAKPGATRYWEAQMNQNPTDDLGGQFQRPWFSYYTENDGVFTILAKGDRPDARVVKNTCWRFCSIDTATDERSWNDYSVIATWSVQSLQKHWYKDYLKRGVDVEERPNPHMFLLDVWRDKVQMPDLEKMMHQTYQRWKPRYMVVEETTNSKQLVQRLQRYTKLPIVPVKAGRTSKGDRAAWLSILMEAGYVHFAEVAPWLAEVENELLEFGPDAMNDDIVDAMSYATRWLRSQDHWEPPDFAADIQRLKADPMVFWPDDLVGERRRNRVFSTDYERL